MSSITEDLKALQNQFIDALPSKIETLNRHYEQVDMSDWPSDPAESLYKGLHGLAGSAGTFGLPLLSNAARELQLQVKKLVESGQIPSPDDWQNIKLQLENLQQLVIEPSATELNQSKHRTGSRSHRNPEPLVYIIEDDADQAKLLAKILSSEGYKVHVFTDLNAFRSEINDAPPPDALVLDMIFPEADDAGLKLLTEIKNKWHDTLPVVFVSVRDDIDARLAAYRAGVSRYLSKPVNAAELTSVLDTLTGRLPAEPYKVLLVDDDPMLLRAQAAVLSSAGLIVEALTDPRIVLKLIDDFRPDALLLDVYMPDINGIELAAVLRERVDYLNLPILFLSAETDVDKQLRAVALGGDDFLVKGGDPNELVSMVVSRSRRGRQLREIYSRLQIALYEREREHQALEHHAIVSVANSRGDISYVNDLFCQISGYSKDELLGQNHRIVKSDVHPPEFYRDLWQTIRRGEVWKGEICNRRKGGQHYWVESTITPFMDSDGRPYQYVSIRTDITRIKAREKAQRAENAMRAVVGQVADSLLAADANTLDGIIQDSLGMVGSHLCADRAQLFVLIENNNSIRDVYEWCAPGVSTSGAFIWDLPEESLPWLWDQVRLGHPVIISDVTELPSQAALEKTVFNTFGLRAMSSFPIRHDGRTIGFFVLEQATAAGEWRSSDLDLLSLMASQIGSALLRAKAEQTIQQQAYFIQDVLDSVSANIAVLNNEGIIVAVNEPWRQFAAANAIEPDVLANSTDVGADYLSICRQSAAQDDELMSVIRGIESVMNRSAARFRHEYPCHSPREQRWFEMSVSPLRGESTGVVISHADITERRLSENVAEAFKERLRRGQYYANIGTWEWNIVTGDLFWTERIAPLFGYTNGQLEISYVNFLAAVHPEDRQAVIDAVNACVEHDIPYEIEHRVVWPDGTVRWLLERGAVMRDDQGQPLQMLGVVQDIHDRKLAQLALIERERQLIEAQSLASLGNWSADLISGELTWSDEIYRIFGYEPGEITPRVEIFHAAVHPEDRDLVNESEREAQRTGFHDLIHRICRPDGSVRHVHELARATLDDQGNLIRLTGTVQDVTERREAELRLRDTEQRFAFAVAGAGDGVWDWDIDSGMMSHSAECELMLGYRQGEMKPSIDTWVSAVHPEDMESVQQQISDYFAERSDQFNAELRLRCKNGDYKWILCRGTIVSRDADGKARRMLGIHSDIHERKLSERALLVFKHVVNSVVDGVLVIDAEGIIQVASPSITSIFGYQQQSVIGNNIKMLMPEPFQSEHDSYLRRYFDTGEERVINRLVEVRGKREDGFEFPLEVAVSEINVGQSRFFVGLMRDISERKLAEQALIDAREEAQRANQAKSEFLSSMSHELRTPMNAILGFGQLLEIDPELSDDHQDNVKEILKAGNHLLELINDVLDLAKIESGRIDLSIEPVELDSVVEECLLLMGPLAAQSNITMGAQGFEGGVVRADRTRFKQILLNLLSNAIKYNRNGGHVTLSTEVRDSGTIRILVSDTGPGIPEKKLDELFQPFKRLGAEDSQIEGTGIGLTITRRIVELMNGKIDVESEVGAGSTFWFELPREQLAGTDIIIKELAYSIEGVEVLNKDSYQSVLYIEDNPANLKLVTQILSRIPAVRLMTAHTPELGIELALAHQPALILLDINLPGMDGYEVLSVLKTDPYLKETPVIAVTANAMPRDIERGIEAGFHDYLTKPLNISKFVDTVTSCLKEN